MKKDVGIPVTLIVVVTFICIVNTANAVPAWPGVHELTQPDGATIKVRLIGDEFFRWYESTDGYAIVKDKADNFWKYAAPAQDKLSYEAISAAVVGQVDPVELKLSTETPLDFRALRKKTLARRSNTPSSSKTLNTATSPPSRIPISGKTTIHNVVILAAFSNHWDTTNDRVLTSKGRLQTEYDALFNEEDYTTGQAVGSVRDYYNEISYGNLEVDSIVTPWVQLPNQEYYYGNNDSYGWDVKPQEMVYDAIEAAADAGFDFSQGDSDGDGWVDCLTIIHSGHGEEWTGDPEYLIWSHQWNLNTVNTKNGVNMLRYHTSPALRGDTSSTSIIRIGVICHEMGHFFGLPDLYDYSGTTVGIGSWGIMAYGSWNGGDGRSPAHFCSWSKYMLGLIQPTRMHSQSAVELPSLETNPVAHMYRDGLSDGEYFLVENRTKTGFDDNVFITPGIIIYHIYDQSNNNDLGTWDHPVVKVEEADGNNSLGADELVIEPGDVWTDTTAFTGGFRDQTGNQSTNAMAYQTHAFNRNDNSAYYSYITLDNFSASGPVMTYDAATLRPTVNSQAVTQPSFTVTWTPSANATSYELQEGVPVTLNTFTDGAEDEDFMYDNWTTGGSVQRSNLGSRTGGYSYVLQVADMYRLYSAVQSITQRTPFVLRDTTNIAFHYKTQLDIDSGVLNLQISNDSGNTWKTLGTYGGLDLSWQNSTINYAQIAAVGLIAGDECIIRFVANFEDTYGATAFPAYGYAIDDIEINNITMNTYGNYVTLDDDITETSYNVLDKADGEYAYRVRAFANNIWQGYGGTGVTTVAVAERTITFQTDGTPGAVLSGELVQTVYAGEDCTPVSVSVPEIYTFSGWMLENELYAAANPITVTDVHDDMTLIATFEIKTYTLTYTAEEHGLLEGETTQTVAHGADGTAVEAVPEKGYRFVSWSDAKTDNPRTETNVTGSLSVVASFERIYYLLEVNQTGMGEVQLNTGIVTIPWSGEVPEDSNIYLKAFPATGYTFGGWTGGQSSTLNPYDFTMDQSYSITAIFTKEGGEEGETEGEPEGETVIEGEKEGEAVIEGEQEGEVVKEGEDEGEIENEGEGESTDNTGCCKSGTTEKNLFDILQDWFLLGITATVLLLMNIKYRII